MTMFQLAGLFLLFIAIVAICSPICSALYHLSDLVQVKTEEQRAKSAIAESMAKLERTRSQAKPLPIGRTVKNKFHVVEQIALPIPAPKRMPKQVVSAPINTNSNIKEYRLPDGSKIAFDTTKVEFSEKSAII